MSEPVIIIEIRMCGGKSICMQNERGLADSGGGRRPDKGVWVVKSETLDEFGSAILTVDSLSIRSVCTFSTAMERKNSNFGHLDIANLTF